MKYFDGVGNPKERRIIESPAELEAEKAEILTARCKTLEMAQHQYEALKIKLERIEPTPNSGCFSYESYSITTFSPTNEPDTHDQCNAEDCTICRDVLRRVLTVEFCLKDLQAVSDSDKEGIMFSAFTLGQALAELKFLLDSKWRRDGLQKELNRRKGTENSAKKRKSKRIERNNNIEDDYHRLKKIHPDWSDTSIATEIKKKQKRNLTIRQIIRIMKA